MVDNHFTITIHDDNGVKQFNLHQFVKKAIFYALLFLGFIALSAIGTILYLNSSVDAIEKKRLDMEMAYNDLKLKNEQLDEKMRTTKKTLETKRKELREVSDSLSEIEVLIGLSHRDDEPLKERVNFTKLSAENMATMLEFIPNGYPVKNMGITSKFGYRMHPTLHKKEFHHGLDLKARMHTPVYAPADGVVEWAGYHKQSGYGNLVILQHNYGFKTFFGHLNKIVVKFGRFVKKGQLIAYTGNSGMSNGPHLHYEVRYLSRALDPYWFVKWDMKNYKEIFEKEKKVPWQSLVTAITQIRMLNQTKEPQSSQRVQK